LAIKLITIHCRHYNAKTKQVGKRAVYYDHTLKGFGVEPAKTGSR